MKLSALALITLNIWAQLLCCCQATACSPVEVITADQTSHCESKQQTMSCHGSNTTKAQPETSRNESGATRYSDGCDCPEHQITLNHAVMVEKTEIEVPIGKLPTPHPILGSELPTTTTKLTSHKNHIRPKSKTCQGLSALCRFLI